MKMRNDITIISVSNISCKSLQISYAIGAIYYMLQVFVCNINFK
jgi:hypothetical protein